MRAEARAVRDTGAGPQGTLAGAAGRRSRRRGVSIRLEKLGGRAREQADDQRRAQLRADLDGKNGQIVKLIAAGDGTSSWSRAVDAFRDRLTQLRLDTNVEVLSRRAEHLSEYCQQLEDVLAAGLPIASARD